MLLDNALVFMYIVTLKDSKEPVTTQYLLSGGVYAYADVPPTDTVFLWLGVCSYCLYMYTANPSLPLSSSPPSIFLP